MYSNWPADASGMYSCSPVLKCALSIPFRTTTFVFPSPRHFFFLEPATLYISQVGKEPISAPESAASAEVHRPVDNDLVHPGNHDLSAAKGCPAEDSEYQGDRTKLDFVLRSDG